MTLKELLDTKYPGWYCNNKRITELEQIEFKGIIEQFGNGSRYEPIGYWIDDVLKISTTKKGYRVSFQY